MCLIIDFYGLILGKCNVDDGKRLFLIIFHDLSIHKIINKGKNGNKKINQSLIIEIYSLISGSVIEGKT